MEKKTIVLRSVTLVALFLAFIGYYFSLYKGYDNSMSTYTNLIVIFACVNSALFNKQNKLESSILNILVKINGVLLVVWVITVVCQLLL